MKVLSSGITPCSSFDLLADLVLIAIGEAPDPSFLPENTRVQTTSWGGLMIDQETLATGEAGIFAAGDATYGPGSIVQAVVHGHKAARSIHAYLRKLPRAAINEIGEDQIDFVSPLHSRRVSMIANS